MSEVSFLAALLAGVLALLSPCSALLLPSFFAYAFASPRALVARTGVFYLGLTLTLVPLGAGAHFASALFYGQRALLISVAGWSIIALGVLQLLGRGFGVPGVSRLHGWVMGRDGDRWVSTLMLGAVYGLAGFCSGPVLGAILTVAATQDSPLAGGSLLAVYALGMTVPMFVMALVWDRFDLGKRRWLRGRTLTLGPVSTHTTSVAAGLLFITMGAVFLRYDGTAGLTGSFGLGDTTDLEYAAQEAVSTFGAAVPAWVLPLIVAVTAATIAWRRRQPHEPGGSQDDPAPERPDDRHGAPQRTQATVRRR